LGALDSRVPSTGTEVREVYVEVNVTGIGLRTEAYPLGCQNHKPLHAEPRALRFSFKGKSILLDSLQKG